MQKTTKQFHRVVLPGKTDLVLFQAKFVLPKNTNVYIVFDLYLFTFFFGGKKYQVVRKATQCEMGLIFFLIVEEYIVMVLPGNVKEFCGYSNEYSQLNNLAILHSLDSSKDAHGSQWEGTRNHGPRTNIFRRFFR